MPTVVALVPMKHHSERVPGKNYRKLGTEPLCFWVLRALMACPSISTVVVDTDSETLMQMLAAAFPSITVLERPHHLRGVNSHIPPPTFVC